MLNERKVNSRIHWMKYKIKFEIAKKIKKLSKLLRDLKRLLYQVINKIKMSRKQLKKINKGGKN